MQSVSICMAKKLEKSLKLIFDDTIDQQSHLKQANILKQLARGKGVFIRAIYIPAHQIL